jgi:TRAP-type C4-dicarboxylate transport system permease small subunit
MRPGAPGVVGVAVMRVMAIHVSASVGLRWPAGRDIPLTLEAVTCAMVAPTFLPLACTDSQDGHVRADVLAASAAVARGGRSRLIQLALAGVFLLLTRRSLVAAIARRARGDRICTGFGPVDLRPARRSARPRALR